VALGAGVGAGLDAIVHDPQTSGGLLAAVDPSAVGALVEAGVGFVEVGRVEAGDPAVELA
jgi:hypothetical protein